MHRHGIKTSSHIGRMDDMHYTGKKRENETPAKQIPKIPHPTQLVQNNLEKDKDTAPEGTDTSAASTSPTTQNDTSRDDSADTTDDSLAPEYPRPTLPRLYFSGKFYTDPSTVNNSTDHYNVDQFRPSFQLPDDGVNSNGYWNPEGTATFAFVDCLVDNVKTDSDTSPSMLPAPIGYETTVRFEDPLVGQPIIYNDDEVYGKISDLDPQMQTVSELFGVRVDVAGGSAKLSTLLIPSSFRDMWGAVEDPEPEGAAYMRSYSAVYQGLLKVTDISDEGSAFLKACRPFLDKSKTALGEEDYPNGALSIRFRVDYYDNDPKSSTFCYGLTSAVIQPWLPNYPFHFDAGRVLQVVPSSTTAATPVTNTAYAYLQSSGGENPMYSICVDLINSLYRTAPRKYQNIGKLSLGYFPDGYNPDNLLFQPLAEVPYMDDDFESKKGGLFEVPIDENTKKLIESRPLGLVVIDSFPIIVLLAEPNDGWFVRADKFVFRLEPIETKDGQTIENAQTVNFYATQFGKRAASQPLLIGVDSTAMFGTGMGAGGPMPGRPATVLKIGGESPSDEYGKSFSKTVMTNAYGHAKVSISGGDCRTPRGFIDGQVFGLRYTMRDKLPELNPRLPNNTKVNIRLFDVFPRSSEQKVDGVSPSTSENPSWLVHILPIFKQFANLYPSMARIVRLDDYGSVIARKKSLIRVFEVDVNDAMSMPTTRDLSKAKRDMILKWLKPDNHGDLVYMNQTVQDVLVALQTVIELEHATMPPYLTALYSIKPGRNKYIADALHDVVVEEMLHMVMACNILIAIGGKPNISKMGFVPKFPGPLPGGICNDLVLRLRKCSMDQIKNFMAVEMPEEQFLPDQENVEQSGSLQQNRYTIGWVYDAISDALAALHEKGEIKFPKDTRVDDNHETVKNQVVGVFKGKLKIIRTLSDAQEAIKLIKEQGEGGTPWDASSAPKDKDTGLKMVSHFYRFAEILNGRRILFKSNKMSGDTEGFSYTGPRIYFDPDGVYNMQDDPKLQDQPLNSLQRERMESFARKYQGLLNGLQRAFSGEPSYLTQCIGLMFQLAIAAQPLMEMAALNPDGTAKADGTTCGISFQMPFNEGSHFTAP